MLIAAAATPEDLDVLVDRRISGLPLEHVVGWAEFCGLRVVLEPGVFVPRHRTEFLVRRAALLGRRGAVVVDLCCGSGAVGAAIMATVPGVDVYAADLAPTAVACARRNLPPRRVFEGDLYQALPADLRGRIDILVANTPYVPTGELEMMPREARLHEPRGALDGGQDGLDVQRRVAAGAAGWLAPGGHLLVETSRRQAPLSAEIFAGAGLVPEVATDEDLEATVVTGSRLR